MARQLQVMSRHGLATFLVSAAIVGPTISIAATAGDIMTGDFYCLTSTEPIIVKTIKAGERFPTGCYNDSALGGSAGSAPRNSSGDPFSALGSSISKAADAMCNPYIPKCGCNQVPSGTKCVPGKNTYNCPVGVCQDTINLFPTLGRCVALNTCRAETAAGKGVDFNLGGLEKLIGVAALQMLMKSNSSEQPTMPSSIPTSSGAGGCTNYYAVTTPTTDPCAYYLPPIGTSTLNLGNLDDQLKSILGDKSSGTSIFDQVKNTSSTSTTGTVRIVATSTVTPIGTPKLNPSLQSSSTLQAGTQGDIKVTESGGTIYATSRDVQGNTETSGFYGGTASGSAQPKGIVAGLCVNRPWAKSIVSYVIPASFFDGLCTWRGYQVGQSVVITQQPSTTINQPTLKPTTVVASSTPAALVQVKIWASPATVPLGARTLIFWNSQGAVSCLVKSPDGSFNQTSLSGGASTVPLTSATTYTISCIGSDGTPATDNVTVHMAI